MMWLKLGYGRYLVCPGAGLFKGGTELKYSNLISPLAYHLEFHRQAIGSEAAM